MGTIVSAGQPNSLSFAATYIALLILLGVVLTVRVIFARGTAQVGIGDGGDKILTRRIRVHGNFCETAPFIIAILVLLPLLGAPEWLVHLIGAGSLTGRVLHALGLSSSAGKSFGRMAGMALTLFGLLAGAISLLILAWR